jgi:hypothetical protein
LVEDGLALWLAKRSMVLQGGTAPTCSIEWVQFYFETFQFVVLISPGRMYGGRHNSWIPWYLKFVCDLLTGQMEGFGLSCMSPRK